MMVRVEDDERHGDRQKPRKLMEVVKNDDDADDDVDDHDNDDADMMTVME